MFRDDFKKFLNLRFNFWKNFMEFLFNVLLEVFKLWEVLDKFIFNPVNSFANCMADPMFDRSELFKDCMSFLNLPGGDVMNWLWNP